MGGDQDLVAADAGGRGALGEVGDHGVGRRPIGHADAEAAIAMSAIVGQESVELDGVVGAHAIRAAVVLNLQVAIAGLHRDGMVASPILGDGGAVVGDRAAAGDQHRTDGCGTK